MPVLPIALLLTAIAQQSWFQVGQTDLTRAVVVVRPEGRAPAEAMAASILVDEVARRSGIRWPVVQAWPKDAEAVIALSTRDGQSSWSNRVPRREGAQWPENKPEGYSIQTTLELSGPTFATIVVAGADGRGVMYGAGRLLRALRCKKGSVCLDLLDFPQNVASAPAYSIRGHQLGYRPTANSYDAWSPEQYEQYIRELIVFGTNCIENTFFQDPVRSPVMQMSRQEMNRKLSEICKRYDIDYWVWAPAEVSLADAAKRAEALKRHEALYQSCPRLDGIFFPGGDPGSNPPELVLPFLKDIAGILARHHPKAGVWLSLQGFSKEKVDYVFDYINKEQPAWLTGLVSGPSSPSMTLTRVRLPKQYKHRWYPDLTHTVRCQYPVDKWDPAFGLTLGREPTCPRPQGFAEIFRFLAPCTDGFLTYSDGIHDDVNKAVWNLLGWDPRYDVRQILTEYSRFFFGADLTEEGADALLGLENNWKGPLATNGSVYGVLSLWQDLERRFPRLNDNWRFQIHLMRAYYDAYTRARLLYETQLEQQAMEALAGATGAGSPKAMDSAIAVLKQAENRPCREDWYDRINQLAETAFKSIGYQTSVKRFHASGSERGAVMDFINHPLNNRWWLEDEFAKIARLPDESARLERLEAIRTWENPGPGSCYDDIGHVGRQPHVIWGEDINTDPEGERHEVGDTAWWEGGMSRARATWLTFMRWPVGMLYEALDPKASYTIRMTGRGDVKPRANGVLLTPTKYSKVIGEFKEFPVPPELVAKGELHLTFDPVGDEHLNWRQQSHVAEVWLLRR
jgi:hypothetical protein